MKTLEEIAEYTISSASGSFYLYWANEFEKLSNKDKNTVRDIVYSEISTCSDCGWYWHNDELEACSDGEERCWQCAKQYEEEE